MLSRNWRALLVLQLFVFGNCLVQAAGHVCGEAASVSVSQGRAFADSGISCLVLRNSLGPLGCCQVVPRFSLTSCAYGLSAPSPIP